jgi:hypothetical protein
VPEAAPLAPEAAPLAPEAPALDALHALFTVVIFIGVVMPAGRFVNLAVKGAVVKFVTEGVSVPSVGELKR